MQGDFSTLEARVREFFAEFPGCDFTVRNVAYAIDANPGSVACVLSKLCVAREINRIERGVYRKPI